MYVVAETSYNKRYNNLTCLFKATEVVKTAFKHEQLQYFQPREYYFLLH